MKFDDFLRELAKDSELKELIDKALEKKETGEKLCFILEYNYLLWLFTKKIRYEDIKEDVRKILVK